MAPPLHASPPETSAHTSAIISSPSRSELGRCTDIPVHPPYVHHTVLSGYGSIRNTAPGGKNTALMVASDVSLMCILTTPHYTTRAPVPLPRNVPFNEIVFPLPILPSAVSLKYCLGSFHPAIAFASFVLISHPAHLPFPTHTLHGAQSQRPGQSDYRYISGYTHVFSMYPHKSTHTFCVSKRHSQVQDKRGRSWRAKAPPRPQLFVPRDRGDNKQSKRNGAYPPEITTSIQ